MTTTTKLALATETTPAILGDQEVFFRRTQDGTLKNVKATILFQPSHLYSVKDTTCLSAEGLFYVNRITGINIVTPPTVFVEGVEQSNPFKIRNPITRATERVFVRKIALGRSLTGNLVAIDQTVEYDPYQYLIEDLLNLAKTTKEAVVYSPPPPPGKSSKLFFPIVSDPSGQNIIGILADTSVKEVQQILATYQRRVKFSERIATTICERNCLKKHPGIGTSTINKNAQGKFQLTVVAWAEDDRQIDEINKFADAIAKGERPKAIETVKAHDIAEREETEYEEAIEIEAVTESNGQGQAELPLGSDRAATLKFIHQGIEIIGQTRFQNLLKRMSLDAKDLESLPDDGLELVLKRLNETIDKEQK